MNEQRNFLLAITLSIIVLLFWQYFVGSKQIEDRSPEQVSAENNTAATQDLSNIPLPSDPVKNNDISIQAPGGSSNNEYVEAGRIKINTENLGGSISLTGAKLDDIQLKNYQESLSEDSDIVHIFRPYSSQNPYYAHQGWVSGSDFKIKLPDDKSVWEIIEGEELSVNQPIKLRWDNGEGLIFTKKYAVDENYLFTVQQNIENNTDNDLTLYPYSLISRKGLPEDYQNFFVLHEGYIGVLGDEGEKKADYSDIIEKTESFENISGGWLGFTDKNWATVIIPPKTLTYQGRFTSQGDGNNYQVDFLGEAQKLNANSSIDIESQIFAGAKEVKILDNYEEVHSFEKFDLLVDWGWFYFLTKPLFYVLQWLYGLLGNYGLSILGVTILIKIVFFPLANKAYVSMSAMKKLSPEMLKIRDTYKDDRAKQQQAIIALYKRDKVNPLSGCIPILIQVPVFFALYKVLLCTMEMRHQPFYGWIQDLSAKDPTTLFNLFGLIPWTPPSFLIIGIWPIIMGFTMFIQMRLNPAPPDPIQQKIFAWMPVFLTFLFAQFSAGLVIYWAWNNTLSSLQQYIIMKRMGVEVELWSNIVNTFKKKKSENH
ncbi:MAG: membrane protein insertase YidC [Hyphomicrobiales bacterium]|jgi:YidC/Oxa1 family membrane protein insertase